MKISELVKQTCVSKETIQFLSQLRYKYFRPVDRLLTKQIVGRETFCEVTGLGRKWLHKAEAWGVINAELRNGQSGSAAG